MRRTRLSAKVVGFFLVAFGVAACQAVAGIEDRTLDPNADGPVASQQCKDYCATVMENCTGDHAVYAKEEICLAVCAKLDPGDSIEHSNENTVACRAFMADEAKREVDYCASAGPGGNGDCGTDCDAYCQLFPSICPDDYQYGSTEDCLKFCNTLTDQSTYNLDNDHGGDTIECRLVHTSSASVDPKAHCPHAPIPPTEPWCIGAADEAPSCEDYCKIEMAACTGDLAQYQSKDQCLAVCEHLDPGTNDDEAGNTRGCRRYHAYSASVAPTTHCYHSGPTGDGHCGDHGKVEDGHTGNCESYCTLVAAACPDDFDNELSSQDECMKQCIELPEAEPDSKYTVKSAEKSSGLQCRVLHTVKAFDDPNACASALGHDQCQP
jgi:hypothetical protein